MYEIHGFFQDPWEFILIHSPESRIYLTLDTQQPLQANEYVDGWVKEQCWFSWGVWDSLDWFPTRELLQVCCSWGRLHNESCLRLLSILRSWLFMVYCFLICNYISATMCLLTPHTYAACLPFTVPWKMCKAFRTTTSGGVRHWRCREGVLWLKWGIHIPQWKGQ